MYFTNLIKGWGYLLAGILILLLFMWLTENRDSLTGEARDLSEETVPNPETEEMGAEAVETNQAPSAVRAEKGPLEEPPRTVPEPDASLTELSGTTRTAGEQYVSGDGVQIEPVSPKMAESIASKVVTTNLPGDEVVEAELSNKSAVTEGIATQENNAIEPIVKPTKPQENPRIDQPSGVPDDPLESVSDPEQTGLATKVSPTLDLMTSSQQETPTHVPCSVLEDAAAKLSEARLSPRNEMMLRLAQGSVVHAAASGTVVKMFQSPYTGHTLYLLDKCGRHCFLYGNLETNTLAEGDTLVCGEELGHVSGDTTTPAGYFYFAVLEVAEEQPWWQGRTVDPAPFLQVRLVE